MTKDKFQKIINFVWLNRSQWVTEDGVGGFEGEHLPASLYRGLSSEAVDAMQNIWSYVMESDTDSNYYPGYKTKAQFAKGYKEELIDLGERFKKEKNNVK